MAKVRLTQQQIKDIKDSVNMVIPDAKVLIFGSRTDLIVISKNPKKEIEKNRITNRDRDMTNLEEKLKTYISQLEKDLETIKNIVERLKR